MKNLTYLSLISCSILVFACQKTKNEMPRTEKIETQKISKKTDQPTLLLKKGTNEEGTSYIISNQTNVLCQYVYGECSPSMTGDIWPNDPLTIFVASGDRLTVSFIGRYGAKECLHCITKVLTGDLPSPQAINLRRETFCY